MRGPIARRVFGTLCSQSICARPPMTSRSPGPGLMSRDFPPCFERIEEGAARTEREDRDARVVELTELLVAVPRDAVVPVAVVVQPDAAEGHAVARR